MAQRPQLVIVNGELAGRRFEVKEGGLRLGRSSSNDIHIPDEELSRNHCFFEIIGESDIRVTDLASANGTYLNGRQLGGDPVVLREGDIIEVGKTKLCVGDEKKPEQVATGVDLGLGGNETPTSATKRRSPLMAVIWVLVLALVGGALWFVFNGPSTKEETPAPIADEESPEVREVVYERVMATLQGIFRYELTISADGVLTVRLDDVPEADRHLVKSQPLSEAAVKEINSILDFKALRSLDREYVGPEPEPQALDSWYLKVVYSTRARAVRVVNTQEPEVFREIREKLEAFSKSELGIWAIQYPREKLEELAQKAVELGTSKWEDRDVKYGNLWESIAAYREAIFYMETLNPKPESFAQAQAGLRRSEEELTRRYQDQRFLADRALNLSQWEAAKRELGILMEMIPDRKDDRNRDAATKLLSAEKNLQKGGK